jgi:diguanylate cyclase
MSAIFPAPRQRTAWPSLLGEGDEMRAQVTGVLFSSATYVVYGGISAVQVAMGLLDPATAWGLAAFGIIANLVFYALVRSGLATHGPDPGLARTQLVAGILLMYAAYASLGPAATGLLVVMASHVVYSMFSMTPRQVWVLVGATLSGLVLTMWVCGILWPERYLVGVQVSGLLYALLVMPLIALLAYRVTAMTKRLRDQHAELQTAMARLHELATRDELTRTHNRRHMNEVLRAQQAQHRRLGDTMSLALVDIDLFKSVNDRHGHAAGDEVLRRFAEIVQQHLRVHDQLSRWGGEEFLVLMPHTAQAQALATLERLQQALARLSRDCMPAGLVITFSAGVAEVGGEEPIEAAIERADQAMYRAKTLGRARCEPG